MKPLHIALAGTAVCGVLIGVTDVLFANAVGTAKLVAHFGPMIVALAFVFAWLHYDAPQWSYRRSPLLNVGIVAIALVFVPVYLIRSRPPGRRLRAILGFLGLFVLWLLIGAVTFAITEHVAT